MDAKPPDRPPVVAQLDPEVKRRLDLMYKNKGKAKPTIEVRDFGPIARMTLGAEWKDLGVGPKFEDKSHGGGLVRWHSYRIEDPRCTLQIDASPKPCVSTSDTIKEIVKSTSGPLAEADYKRLKIFGTSGNSRLYEIESVEVAELGGKKVIVMTGKLKETGTREKTIYVSLSDDWMDRYEFGIGGSPDKSVFEKQVAKFDAALRTVKWRQVENK